MVIGVKFCGGCNPVYDRGGRVRKFMEDNPEHEYVTSGSGGVCDIWMVVCGCSRRCAGTEGLKAQGGVALIWDEAGFRRLEQQIREAAQGEPADSQKKRVLRLHERAVRQRTVTKEDIQRFAELTGDESRLHLDPGTAAKAGFERPPVHGMLLDSLVSALMGTRLPGSGTVYMEHTARFIRPVYQGDTVEITVEFLSCEEREDCYVGTFRGTCTNQRGERVLTAMCSQMMKKSLFEISKESERTDDDEFGTV